MDDLCKPVSRDERQAECVRKWIQNKCIGAFKICTGFGKTRVTILCLQKVLIKIPNFRALVVVPTEALKNQWNNILQENNLNNNVEVSIINSAIKKDWDIDVLVLDEFHKYASNTNFSIFSKVKYKAIIALSATIERLDGRHSLLLKKCPIIDSISVQEALANGWLSEYSEYEVLLDVDNIDEYRKIDRENVAHFEFFDFNWETVSALIGPKGFNNRKEYATILCRGNKDKWNDMFKLVTYHAMGFMRTMQARKQFINNHSKKIEIARKIIEARPFSKILTFSNNIKMAEAIGGPVYSGKDSKKHSKSVLEEFNNSETGVLHSCKRLIEGADVKGLNVEIILGHDSSITRATQTRGRGIRREGDKHAEIFNLVINDTKDCTWFNNSHKDVTIIPIDEANLIKVLNKEPFETYKKPVTKFNYRF